MTRGKRIKTKFAQSLHMWIKNSENTYSIEFVTLIL